MSSCVCVYVCERESVCASVGEEHACVGTHILVHGGFWFLLRVWWRAFGQGHNKRKRDIISSGKEATDHGPARRSG